MVDDEDAIVIYLVLKGEKWELMQDWAAGLAELCVAHREALTKDEVPVRVSGTSKDIMMLTAKDIECEVEVYGDALWQLTRLDYKETK